MSRAAFVIGCGSSIKGHPMLERLAGRFVLACNLACELVRPSLTIAVDWKTARLIERRGVSSAPIVCPTVDPPGGHEGGIVRPMYYSRDRRLRCRSGEGRPARANNSGAVAVSIAHELGRSPIYLLGFDLAGGHAHSGYPWGDSNDRPTFEGHALELRKVASLGRIDVRNLGPRFSLLLPFPREEWMEVLS